MPTSVPLILASASPRRKQLLTEAGYTIEVDPSDIDEPEPAPGTLAVDYVAMLAWRKAAAVARRRGGGLVLAADTACAVEGEILNKPLDRADAERMIRLQEGCDTEVLTGVCLYRAERDEWVGAVEVSVVRFRVLDDAERRGERHERACSRACSRGRRHRAACDEHRLVGFGAGEEPAGTE
jgi:septum formation protein